MSITPVALSHQPHNSINTLLLPLHGISNHHLVQVNTYIPVLHLPESLRAAASKMDAKRRSKKPTATAGKDILISDEVSKPSSDALSLPLFFTNAVFFTIFFWVVYYLLTRWREKIRDSTPLHLVTFTEIIAIFVFVGSFIYLLGFFGMDFVLSVIRPSEEVDEDEYNEERITDNNTDFVQLQKPKVVDFDSVYVFNEEDMEIIKSVAAGTTPSYSLESKVGDCKRAAAIRREALQTMTGKSLSGIPLEGFDYESILGQCCEMPVGYVQIPVGIAGPLLLDGREYQIPMATTEGCLVASLNRGCKAIHLSGGANSVLLKDGMTRAPVVRFSSVQRAAELKFWVEDPANFDALSIVFNRFVVMSQ